LGVIGCSSSSPYSATPADRAASLADPGPNVDPWKALFLVDESIVNDERAKNDRTDGSAGPWSFRHLVEQMVDGTPVDAVAFTEAFFQHFHDTSVNEFEQCDRGNVEVVLDRWRDGAERIDLRRSPFRLLAIANREDIIFNASSGELRFVLGIFGFGRDKLTMIFEYRLPAFLSRAEWAQRFQQLSTMPFGESYNALLQQITEDVVTPHPGDPNCPVNGNCISQVRVNERIFNDGTQSAFCNFLNWEMEEFHLVDRGGLALVPVTVKQTPHWSFNGQDRLAQLLRDNREAIVNHEFVFPDVPRSQGGFLGGRAIEGFLGTEPEAFQWHFDQLRDDPQLVDAFRFDTCNGCHHERDDSLTGFYHVEPGSIAEMPLTGDGKDRVSDFVKNHELPLRICFMRDLLDPGSCPAAHVALLGRAH
jgi:hypothetical protein